MVKLEADDYQKLNNFFEKLKISKNSVHSMILNVIYIFSIFDADKFWWQMYDFNIQFEFTFFLESNLSVLTLINLEKIYFIDKSKKLKKKKYKILLLINLLKNSGLICIAN